MLQHGVVRLGRLTASNLHRARALRVHPKQRRFIAPVERSLSEARRDAGMLFRLAYVGETAVGYVLLGPQLIDGVRVVNVIRLMIDRRFQRCGYGRRLLDTALGWIDSFDPPVELVRLSVVPGNVAAEKLYASAGFTAMGFEDGELALYLATRHAHRLDR